MPITDQVITKSYALYNGDAMSVLPEIKDGSVHLSIYSPPFQGLYVYSSDYRDLSNCLNSEEFFAQYQFIVEELARVTMPGRFTLVHCCDIPTGNTGLDHLIDFPGEVIRLHQRLGWQFTARYCVWKDALLVRNRTMTKSLMHKTLVEDSTRTSIANCDQLLAFRRSGTNPVPVAHPQGLDYYAGSQHIPHDVLQYRHWTGNQLENKYSHWIFQQYASSFWTDVRIDRVLPYREAKGEDDLKHCHPLQLDVIERGVIMYSNPGETVLSPFAGVGSEVYGAVILGRRAIGVELHKSYFAQAVRNVAHAATHTVSEQQDLFTRPQEDVALLSPFTTIAETISS